MEDYFSTKIKALHRACFPVNFRNFYQKQYVCDTYDLKHFWEYYNTNITATLLINSLMIPMNTYQGQWQFPFSHML